MTQRFLQRHDVYSHLVLVEWGSGTLQADSAIFVKHKIKDGLDPIAIFIV